MRNSAVKRIIAVLLCLVVFAGSELTGLTNIVGICSHLRWKWQTKKEMSRILRWMRSRSKRRRRNRKQSPSRKCLGNRPHRRRPRNLPCRRHLQWWKRLLKRQQILQSKSRIPGMRKMKTAKM